MIVIKTVRDYVNCLSVFAYCIHTLQIWQLPADEARQPISVQEFENHVRARHKNSDNLFADEYEVS